MLTFLARLVESRRKVRRAEYAVALLRKEAAVHRRAKDRDLAKYLDAVADLIEKSP